MDIPRELFYSIREKIFFTPDEKGMFWAINHGYKHLLIDALRLEIPAIYSNRNIIRATIVGNLDLVKWFYENCPESNNVTPMSWATFYGHFHIVKWLHRNGCSARCFSSHMNYAAEKGYIHIVKWLHENCRAGCTVGALDWAAANGHFETVKWLVQNRGEGYSSWGLHQASINEHYEIVEWLEKHGRLISINL